MTHRSTLHFKCGVVQSLSKCPSNWQYEHLCHALLQFKRCPGSVGSPVLRLGPPLLARIHVLTLACFPTSWGKSRVLGTSPGSLSIFKKGVIHWRTLAACKHFMTSLSKVSSCPSSLWMVIKCSKSCWKSNASWERGSGWGRFPNRSRSSETSSFLLRRPSRLSGIDCNW